MKTINIAILGATGRTGSLVLAHALEDAEYNVTGALVSESSSQKDKDVAPGRSSLRYTSNLQEALKDADLAVDFSSPHLSCEVARLCGTLSIALLMATTGQDERTHACFQDAAERIPVLVAPNTSLAVIALHEASKAAKKILGPSFDTEIFEVHHKHKKDSPSGTALSLALALTDDHSKIVSHRKGLRTTEELGIASARGGDVAGEHTVYFFGEGERLELTQRATSRHVFAKGALTLGRRLMLKGPGLFGVQDLW